MSAERCALVVLVAAVTACAPSDSDAQPGTPGEPGGAWLVTDEYRLVPSGATVRTGSTRALEVQRCTQEEESTADGTILTALEPTCTRLSHGSLLGAWSVNGTTGGSAEAGTVAPSGGGAVYTAPARSPPPTRLP